MTHTHHFFAASLLLAASAASALTITVPDPGNSIATPSQAIAIAQPGDVIEITGTSYTEALVVTVSNLTLRGMELAPVTLRGPSGPYMIGGPSHAGEDALVVSNATGVVLENLSIVGGDGGSDGTNSNRTGYSAGSGLRCENSTVHLANCDLQGGTGGTGASPSPVPVPPVHGSGGYGLRADGSTVTVEDSSSTGGLNGSGSTRSCAYRLIGNASATLVGTTPAPTDPPTCVDAGSQLLNTSAVQGWTLY
jgi:hypothetical protein